ncbi:MAG: hypothetical protein PHP13_01225 [Methanomicrobium sp.]|jgi:uncharacterized membrane protein|nr:hypothetical protein [Methanomicrobium sp.]MDD4300314.1 hypothetical protein [Methanomicrobium sp.]
MSEKLVYGGAILSGSSIIISGILIAFTIMALNGGEQPGSMIYLLPLMAVLLVAGVSLIIYGSRREDAQSGASQGADINI